MGGRARVSGVILAAGASRRFGGDRPKQLFEIGGAPLLRRAVETALSSRLRQILVVIGHQAERVTPILAGLAVEVVENTQYREGQSRSVKVGLARVERNADAAMFMPCDQPYLDTQVIDHLIGQFEETGGPIVVPIYRGHRGAPVVVARSFFSSLERITGDEGGRQLFEHHADKIVEVSLENARPLEDLDSSDAKA